VISTRFTRTGYEDVRCPRTDIDRPDPGGYGAAMGDLVPLTRDHHRRTAAPARKPGPAPEPLWREALGRQLRTERSVRGERIADVAGRAGVSPQYLSEVERGRKDPSSEILSALAGAVNLTVRELTCRAAVHLSAGAHPSAAVHLSAAVHPSAGAHGPVLLAA